MFAACISAQHSHAGHIPRENHDVFVVPDSTESTTQKRAKKSSENLWLLDSGASVHVTHEFSAFITGTLRRAPGKGIRVANGKRIAAKGIGDVRISLPGIPSIVLKDVLYVPECKSNIISTKRLWYSHGIKSTFGEGCTLSWQDKRGQYDRAKLPCLPGTYRMPVRSAPSDVNGIDNDNATAGAPRLTRKHIAYDILHKRLGHCGLRRAKLAMSRSVGLPTCTFPNAPPACPGCDIGMHQQKLQPSLEASVSGGETSSYINATDETTQQRQDVKPTATQYFGQLVHTDLCGPFPKDREGYQYAICFVDDYTRYAAIYFLKSKHASNVKQAMERYQKSFRKHFKNGHVDTWHTDNGGEFTSSDLDDFCDEFAIRRSFSVPYEPKQNAKAERLWGIVLTPMRKYLAESGVSDKYWTHCMQHCLMLHNVLPSSVLPNQISPSERLRGKLPDLSRLRVWGCKSYYHIPTRDRKSKLHPRNAVATYLGHDPLRKGDIVEVHSLNRITTSARLRFREDQYYEHNSSMGNRIHADYHYFEDWDIPSDHRTRAHDDDTTPMRNNNMPTARHADPVDDSSHGDVPRTLPDGTTLPGYWRENHCENSQCEFNRGHDGPCSHELRGSGSGLPSSRTRSSIVNEIQFITDEDTPFSEFGDGIFLLYDDALHGAYIFSTDVLTSIPCPATYEQAIISVLKHRWKLSMDDEIKGLLAQGTWETWSRSKLPRGKRPVKSRWVYTIKHNRDGTIDRFKSRFVVCGYSQIQGKDYDRAFSATMRASSFRTLMAMAAILKLKLEHIDVSNAFTQANIDDVEIFVEPAKGFEEWEYIGGHKVSKVLKLRKALYGTKQASRLWQETLAAFLTSPEIGFHRLISDPCLFVRWNGDECMVLGIYVDDIVCGHMGDNLFNDFLKKFQERFVSNHLGKLSWFLGMAIDQEWINNDHVINVHQSKNIMDMVEKFAPDYSSNKIKHAKPYNTDTFKLLKTAKDAAKDDDDLEIIRYKMTSLAYLSLVGSLMYVAFMTRPDIAFAMSVLCKFMSDPTPECYFAALGVLQYLANTPHVHLSYSWSGKVTLPPYAEFAAVRHVIESSCGFHMYTDSSWGEAYPAYGYGIFLANGCVSYLSKQLKLVCESSCEAEYAAVAYSSKELRFLVNLMNELQLPIQAPYVSFIDNSAALDVAKDYGVSGRTKHFDLAIHIIRKLCEDNLMLLTWIPRSGQLADWFTHILTKNEIRAIMTYYLPGLPD